MACPQNKQVVWIDEVGDRPVVLRPGFLSKKRLFTMYFNHSGEMEVDILPKKTTMTSHHYTGTVLAKVVPVQEPPTNFGTTRTVSLHNKPARLQSKGHNFGKKDYKSCPTHLTALTKHHVTVGCF